MNCSAARCCRVTRRFPTAFSRRLPCPACERLLQTLDELGLDVVSINAFPIRAFHAPRVKEQVYSPPWTDGAERFTV